MNTGHIKPGKLLESSEIVRLDKTHTKKTQEQTVIRGQSEPVSSTKRAVDPRVGQLVDAINKLPEVRADVVANAHQELSSGKFESRQTAIDVARAILGE